jgi:hypothetical protein
MLPAPFHFAIHRAVLRQMGAHLHSHEYFSNIIIAIRALGIFQFVNQYIILGAPFKLGGPGLQPLKPLP